MFLHWIIHTISRTVFRFNELWKNGNRHSHHSRMLSLTCAVVLEFTEPEKWPLNSEDLYKFITTHEIMLNLTKMHGYYPILPLTYSESNSNDHLHTELVQMKFNSGTGFRSGLFGGHFSGSVNSSTWQCRSTTACVNGVNVYFLSSQNSKTFDISHTFLPLIVAKS